MKHFDVIVVGSGAGMMIADAAVNSGRTVALVEMGLLGGTCLNVGCIPSKMIIYPADLVNQIKHAEQLGIKATIEEIDFGFIMQRTRDFVEHDRKPMEEAVKHVQGLTFYPVKGEFIDDYTMKVGDETIRGDAVFLVSGARVALPPIKGLDSVDYLTNDNVWELTEKPESMVIVGGGLIAAAEVVWIRSFCIGRNRNVIVFGAPLRISETPEILTSCAPIALPPTIDANLCRVNKRFRYFLPLAFLNSNNTSSVRSWVGLP